MNRQERAKQFMPFASLRGYYDMILQQERIKEPRKVLSDYEADKLSNNLNQIKKGMIITIRYYNNDAYETIKGCVSAIDETLKTLTIVKTKINFEDILSIDFDD